MSGAPLWCPSKKEIAEANLSYFIKKCKKKNYKDLYKWSINSFEDFWAAFWEFSGIIGDKPSSWAIENRDSVEKAVFFKDAKINIVENLLKYRDNTPAIYSVCEGKKRRTLTHRDLYNQVSTCEQFFSHIGIKEGDRVACYLPNIPEAVIGMLATASHGCIFSTCSPDFGVAALIERFRQINPKILMITDGYFYNGKIFDMIGKVKDIVDALPSIEHIVIVPYVNNTIQPLSLKSPCIHVWSDIQKEFLPKEIALKRYPFNHPLFIAYSSGTTGMPKCIIHGAGGTLIQLMKEHQLHCDIKPLDVIFYFTTCSWMMWHWLIFALASGATLLLYDGSPIYPDIDYLFQLVEQYSIKLFGTSAKYLDNLSKHSLNVGSRYDLSSMKIMTSTGSPLLPATFRYVYENIKCDLHLASISGGTDIISCFVLGNPLAPVYEGEIQTPGLGMWVDAVDEKGHSLSVDEKGELVCRAAFPSRPLAFWGDIDGSLYHKAYFSRIPGMWCHGDFISKTDHGGFFIHGRSDATLNPGGVRIGTAEIYRQVESLGFIAEALAIGQPFEGDERIILFVKLQNGLSLSGALVEQIKNHIRLQTTPRHVPAIILQVPDIPRTKNNKIAELIVKDILLRRETKNKGALLNPESLDYFVELVSKPGFCGH